MSPKSPIRIPAVVVKQWFSEWDHITFDRSISQAKPEQFFYLCSIPAIYLKRLTGVYRRSTKGFTPRAKDPNVQRGHEEERSDTIREFVKFGFPWCEMGPAKRQAPGADDLRKPGWLPTSILLNILESGAERNGQRIPNSDLITVDRDKDRAELILPKSFNGSSWIPDKVFPLEVIDGQHRLWAFEDFDPGIDFELPVVAFHGLDRSWQAYLFWSINITPKRINRSLAFDLYPLLRREDWLDRFAGHSIYRETRSQELVEALWSNAESPWYQRINMLGETVTQRGTDIPMASQAAWIRSLMASFIKEWPEAGGKIGGLFGAPRSADEPFLPWKRAMQAAFLIVAGKTLRDSVKRSQALWARVLRTTEDESLLEDDNGDSDPAFYGRYSLLTTDQGIRGFLFIVNDLCFVRFRELKLEDWTWDDVEVKFQKKSAATDEQAVSAAVSSLEKQQVFKFLAQIAKSLSDYDWRASSTPNLEEKVRQSRLVFRGSGGYRELRKQLLEHLAANKDSVGKAASAVIKALGY